MFSKKVLPALLCVGIGLAGSAQAQSVSYYLDQSNTANAPLIADGFANYLKVTIDNEGTAGYVNFTVDVQPALLSLAGSNFGIDKFAFNVTSGGILPPDCGGPGCVGWSNVPTGWTANTPPPTNQNDGFGKYDVEVSTTGSNRLTTLSFSILSNNTLNQFLDLSANPAAEGNAYFAAHVAGFSTSNTSGGTVTSAYFGATSLIPAVPVPAPLVLLASALIPLLRFAKRKK